MKQSIFVWIPILLFAALLPLGLLSDYPVPFSGAIILLGGSIAGYTGFKSLGVYMSNKTIPLEIGKTEVIKSKMVKILIAMYVLIIEAMIIQYIKPTLELPLDDLFVMAGICSATVLGGVQAIKSVGAKE